MNQKLLFKKLKNGNEIEAHSHEKSDIVRTIRMNFNGDCFTLHSYVFDGNNVFDEENYKEEKIIEYQTFQELMNSVHNDYPTLEINSL